MVSVFTIGRFSLNYIYLFFLQQKLFTNFIGRKSISYKKKKQTSSSNTTPKKRSSIDFSVFNRKGFLWLYRTYK